MLFFASSVSVNNLKTNLMNGVVQCCLMLNHISIMPFTYLTQSLLICHIITNLLHKWCSDDA